MATPLQCGSSLYVFTNKADRSNTICVIDSHGFRPPTKSYFMVPAGVTINLYVHRHAFLLVGRE